MLDPICIANNSQVDANKRRKDRLDSFIPVYNFSNKIKAQAAFPLRLRNDMTNFLNSCSLRMNCPFQLRYAFKPDGTQIADFT